MICHWTWNCTEQTEVVKSVEPDFPLAMETRQSKMGRNKKKINPHGEEIVVNRIVLDDVTDSKVGLDDTAVLQDIDLIADTETDCIDDRS